MPTLSAERRQGRAARIDLVAALPWLIQNARPPAGGARERLAAEQADSVALRNARLRGELIFAHDVSETLFALATSLTSQLDGLPGRVANELAGINDPAVIRARLLDETHAVRAAFAEAADGLADKLGSATDDDEAPARQPRSKAKRRRPPTNGATSPQAAPS